MQQIKLRSKFGLALIAVIAISVAVATQASSYYIQAADAQAKLPNNSVRSETIVDGQVKAQDIAAGVIPDGGGAVELVVVERTVQGSIPANEFEATTVSCNSDETVVGGGFAKVSSLTDVFNSNKEGNGWEAGAFNSESFTQIFHVFAECAHLTQ